MIVQSYVFDCPSESTRQYEGPLNQGLKMTGKRYTTSFSQNEVNGLTLLFTHCIGSHKEQWEPVIESLFTLQQKVDKAHRIREAWSFDWQNHGDAAVHNRELLKVRTEGVSVHEWWPAITDFVRSPYMKGHRIVPVGHSAGAATVILTTKGMLYHELPYVAMVLIEPTMMTREVFNAHLDDRMASMDSVVAATSARRDFWLSKEQAFEYFKGRFPWKSWDPRVLRLLTEHGLEELPSGGVTLKCDKKQEAISYPDVEPHFEGTLQFGRICHSLPIHVIWGTRIDFWPEYSQNALSDASEGRVVASVTRIQQAGHMVVQEQPELVSQAIRDILSTINVEGSSEQSKL
ncbi:hypothetical protein BYT27DRAFT_7238055 [Phlegmacium glaucopus]|nr:hypothetical protein BYT27DRAFT_7238055 [Phlegmacium glaucopus]